MQFKHGRIDGIDAMRVLICITLRMLKIPLMNISFPIFLRSKWINM